MTSFSSTVLILGMMCCILANAKELRTCVEINSFSDLETAIENQTSSIVLTCPFVLVDDNNFLDIKRSDFSIVCSRQNANDTCEFRSTSAHLNIPENVSRVKFIGFKFSNSRFGAVHVKGDGISFIDCMFESNDRAFGVGGAMEIYQGTERSFIMASEFINNESEGGGAIYAAPGSDFIVTSSIFQDNKANSDGGAIIAATDGRSIQNEFQMNSAYAIGSTLYEKESFFCDGGENYACSGSTYTSSTCDGIYRDGFCELFSNVCEYPSGSPSINPSGKPSILPTSTPTDTPTISTMPTIKPSSRPTILPTEQPSGVPSSFPSAKPSSNPTQHVSFSPSQSSSPSENPTATPTTYPSAVPSISPTSQPSQAPSLTPSQDPSSIPTTMPSVLPTSSPSYTPSSSPSNKPTSKPSFEPSLQPTDIPSEPPTVKPSTQPSDLPTSKPSTSPSTTPSQIPSASPTTIPSSAPSLTPTTYPSLSPSGKPSADPSQEPSEYPSSAPSLSPTTYPSQSPSEIPSVVPSQGPSEIPSTVPTLVPTLSISPSVLPSTDPTQGPSISMQPTVTCNMNATQRADLITEKIINIRRKEKAKEVGTVQNDALKWIINEDEMYLCPNSDNLIQRYAAAVIMMGLTQSKTLSNYPECKWKGLKCTHEGQIKEIKMKKSQGILPVEISLLPELRSLVVQQGKIKYVPDGILELPHLENFDVDKNSIQGPFPSTNNTNSEMLRLDINYNFFQGNLDFLSQLPNLKEAHLDNNLFQGTIPEAIGNMSNLRILTLHRNRLSGLMPESVCRLREDGKLKVLMADCGGEIPKVNCTCCTHCFPN